MTISLHRRSFLKLGGAAAAAALSPLAAVADKPAKKRAIKKAVMYATIEFPGSVLEKFQALKAAGFEGVEPMSHMKQDEVAKALDETGLKAASVCCSTHWDNPLSHPDPKQRQDSAWRGCSSRSATPSVMGPLRCCWCREWSTKTYHYDDCFERSVAEIKKALPVAEDTGVKIAIENVWNNFITKPEQAMAFLDAIDSPLVGWHFDIGNVLKYGAPEEWIPVLGKRILKLHIKEYGKLKGLRRAVLRGRQQLAGHHEGAGRRGLPGLGHLRTARRPVEGRRRAEGPVRAHGQDICELRLRGSRGCASTRPPAGLSNPFGVNSEMPAVDITPKGLHSPAGGRVLAHPRLLKPRR